MPTTKLIQGAAIFLLTLTPGCSVNDQPQAATPPTPLSTQNEVTPVKEATPSGVVYQSSPPPPSLVKHLLQTKGCTRCDLEGANLQGADLAEARMEGVDLQGANLQGANLSEAEAEEVDLEGANLKGAILEQTKLTGATMPDGTTYK